MAVETGEVEVLMFSINPCYDLQPAGEEVDALWAETSYARPCTTSTPTANGSTSCARTARAST